MAGSRFKPLFSPQIEAPASNSDVARVPLATPAVAGGRPTARPRVDQIDVEGHDVQGGAPCAPVATLTADTAARARRRGRRAPVSRISN